MIRVFEVELGKDEVLNANHRNHFQVQARKTANLRQLGFSLCKRTETWGKDRPADVVCVVTQDTRRRFDPPNFYPTFKAIIDGMVDAGVFTDDNRDVIPSITFTSGSTLAGKGRTRFEVYVK